ncbi:hypothetical protein UPYG_G00187520 [Umbra pygmaea]|uniref:Uncharacterized protein n=1 Tax=Umbra pygmaea TaxID=75934 RepID=A0ABD0XAP8_UMBPY
MTDKKCQAGLPEIRTTLPDTGPWHKEKLTTKCLSDDKKHLSGALDGRRWRFLNAEGNVLRDGYPTPSDTERPPPAKWGISPSISGISSQTSLSDKSHKKRFSKEQACFSKQNPRPQAQREHMATIEVKLKQHPLVLYPHLEHNMPSELFDQVRRVLDPDVCVNRVPAVNSKAKEVLSYDCPKACETTQESEDSVWAGTSVRTMKNDSCPKNPYKQLQTKWTSAKEDQITKVKGLPSPSQDEDIKKVTKLLCDWVKDLHISHTNETILKDSELDEGEENNLTESAVLGLFVSGYEKKQSLTSPIQVANSETIPEDLHDSVVDLHISHNSETILKDSELYEDEDLEQMHVTQEFIQFIINRGRRVPRFLNSILAKQRDSRSLPDDGSASTKK